MSCYGRTRGMRRGETRFINKNIVPASNQKQLNSNSEIIKNSNPHLVSGNFILQIKERPKLVVGKKKRRRFKLVNL